MTLIVWVWVRQGVKYILFLLRLEVISHSQTPVDFCLFQCQGPTWSLSWQGYVRVKGLRMKTRWLLDIWRCCLSHATWALIQPVLFVSLLSPNVCFPSSVCDFFVVFCLTVFFFPSFLLSIDFPFLFKVFFFPEHPPSAPLGRSWTYSLFIHRLYFPLSFGVYVLGFFLIIIIVLKWPTHKSCFAFLKAGVQ